MSSKLQCSKCCTIFKGNIPNNVMYNFKIGGVKSLDFMEANDQKRLRSYPAKAKEYEEVPPPIQ